MAAANETTPSIAIPGNRQLVIGAPIGRGSRAVVHLARLEGDVLARPVAVKVFEPGAETEEILRPVRRAALIQHPNVVQITDAFVSGPSVHVILELVDGMSLQGFMERWQLARRRMPLEMVLFIACEIAEGLSGARQTSMSHHDLGPRQVQLSWHGEVKVGDFGRHATGDVASGVRRAGSDVRTRVSHLAPEVARGARGDARSDVFSLGVLLHEMLYGPRFARVEDTDEVLDLTRQGIVPRPVLAPVLPEGVEDILSRALEVDPRARQPHAGVVAYDLRREALKLGVGDARVFLRTALFEMSEGGHDTTR